MVIIRNEALHSVLLIYGFSMLKWYLICISIVFSLFINSCSNKDNLRIAISKGIGSSNYELYEKWLKSVDKNIEVINLYGLQYSEALEILETCDGLVLSGGPDVHPAYFGREEDTARCKIDLYRDTLEFKLINKADSIKLPILAICRGAQIINVAYGGSLIIDIPEDTKSEVSHQTTDGDVFHDITIMDNSLLNKISDNLFGVVNSNHHQSVDKIADRFHVTATTNDGIIEAFENKDKTLPYLLAVQWHPERLDSDSRLSQPLALSFINEVKKNKLKLSEK